MVNLLTGNFRLVLYSLSVILIERMLLVTRILGKIKLGGTHDEWYSKMV